MSATLLLNNVANIPAALLERERRFKAKGLIVLGSYLFGFGLIALPMARAGFGTASLAMAHLMQVASRAVVLFAMRPSPMSIWPNGKGSGRLLNDGLGFSAGQIGN